MRNGKVATWSVLGLMCVGTILGGSAWGGEIAWRSGPATTAFRGAADAAQDIAALTMVRDAAASQHIVVQFDRPLTAHEHAALAVAGVTLLNYLGNDAFFAAVDATRLDPAGVAQVTALQVAVPVARDWKLHPDLVADVVVPWSLVRPTMQELADGAAMPVDPTVGAYVLFHPDVPLDTTGRALVAQYGATVRAALRSINGLVIELPYTQIKNLALEDAVQYIEPPLPQFAELNNSNRAITGSDTAQAPPYNLDGTGVTVLVYDGGTVLTTHADLAGRVRVGDGGALSDHSTHVAGTIGGTGAASAGLYRGMAPGVQIESYEFDTGGALEAGFLYTDPGDIEHDYNESMNMYGADIASNSIGSNVARNGFPCEWEGDYGATSALIDAIVRGSLGAPFRVVWAGGNERGNGSCGTSFNTVAPPSGAKNHLSIGALNSNDDTVTYFTSFGPTDDGRLKPDFSAPGCQTSDDQGVTSCSSSGGYVTYCGTSMATPTVSGMTALLLQDYRLYYPGEPDPRNSTLKALYANTAVDLGNAGPDFRSGYGSVRIVPAIETMRAGNFVEGELGQGDTVQMLVIVSPGDPELKVTLAWDDVPGTPNVSPALVNDLDLRVFDPSLTRHYPWTLNPADPNAPAVQTQEDHTNNIEQVYIANPTPGAYLIELAGTNVPQPSQPFSLVASPVLIRCSTKGTIKLNQAKYACQSTVLLTINDCDLNTNDAVVETVQITVASAAEPAGELVTLTETGPETALFTGTVPLDTTDAPGVLLVGEGDTMVATYIDADDGFGNTNVVVTATAPIDCTPPVVSGVQAVNVEPRNAQIVFSTDELATAVVHYGETCGVYDGLAGAPGTNTNHSVALTGLQDDITYYYAVEATDQAGNVTFDDNGGACYTFTTPQIPDYFTELFPTFDLANSALLFAPNGSVDFYSVCRYETLVLPTDPAGGTGLPMSDTSSATVQLTDGKAILFYGQSYTTLFVNANGNITLDSSDSDSTETIEDHFSQPRISLLFDDLDPSEGGAVSYKQLSDRIVVTWLNVPEDNGANTNTFQVELYFDGRIQLAWLQIDATDGLVGFSTGDGVPVDFLPSDLSSYGPCGPRPPSAAGRTVVLGEGRQATVELLASDDGLPDPPGALSYIITALPTYDLYDAGDSHLIVAGDLPYTLTGGGNTVVYVPLAGFVGLDQFDFIVNDGGAPPDAGDSNVATVVMQVDPVLGLPFFDSFPATTFDMTNWAVVDGPNIDDVGINEPTPPYSARINGTPSGRDELTTHLIDLSGYPGARLQYAWERTGGGESPDSGENLWVEYIDANGVWQLLAQYAGDGADLVNYIHETIELPPEALHDSFRLRFRARGTAGATQFDDWFVDDVFIGLPGMPYAIGQSLSLARDGFLDITLIADDPDSDPLTYLILSLPTHGTLIDLSGSPTPLTAGDLPYTLVAGADVRYTPDAGYAGPDEFSYAATDGTYTSNTARVLLDVQPVLALPFFEPFETTEFDFGRWYIVDGATIDTRGIAEPSQPNALRLNGNPDGGDLAETYAIDLSAYSNIHLSYYWERTGSGESPDANDDLFVEYLNDIGEWTLFAQYLGSGPDMETFALADGALPADAHHDNFRLRFRNLASVGASDDWFVDDIRIYSPDAPTALDQAVPLTKYAWADVTLMATDPGADPLLYTLLTLPAHGVLVDRATGLTVTPAALPYTLPGGAQVVRYIPTFAYEGSDGFTFEAFDGTFHSNTATVAIQIGGLQPLYSFPLDVDPGWQTEGLWEFGVPQGVGFDPPVAYTGQNIYGYNLAGTYEPLINPAKYLTTTAFDLSQAVNTELRFQRWLGVEDATFDHASIQLSTDGGSWSDIWVHSGGNVNDLAWSLYTYDISALADGHPTVYIRWGMGPTDDSAQYSGWQLDDIAIYGELTAPVGDLDHDGDLDGDDQWLLFAAWPNCEGAPGYAAAADLDGDGCVTLADHLFWAAVYRDYVGDPGALLPAATFGDYERDGDLDAADWAALSDCLAGPGNAVSPLCAGAFDLDLDGDVDLADVSILGVLYPY